MNKVQGKTSCYVLAALMCWTTTTFADQPSQGSQFAVPQHFAPQQNANSQALMEELVEQGLPQAWLEEALGQADTRRVYWMPWKEPRSAALSGMSIAIFF